MGKQARVQHQNLNPQTLQTVDQLHQRRHHAIDLRVPGIGDERQLHAATFSAG